MRRSHLPVVLSKRSFLLRLPKDLLRVTVDFAASNSLHETCRYLNLTLRSFDELPCELIGDFRTVFRIPKPVWARKYNNLRRLRFWPSLFCRYTSTTVRRLHQFIRTLAIFCPRLERFEMLENVMANFPNHTRQNT